VIPVSASYEDEWRARFGETTGVPQDAPEVAWLRELLRRRTHRRYADRPVAEPLLRLLLAAAFSASSKSDFQQATVIRVNERDRRDRLAALVPDKVFPLAGLCVGYPAAEGHISMRLPLDVTLHTDRYDDSRLDDAVTAYDLRRDARYSLPREQQRQPEVFGYASFYGWSEDKARQATRPEGQDFPSYLRARGFTID